ncbi:hypothetical protein LTS10_006896 [Elasticomyces elasticus]|nr:hypothetical protein LTS10_006896 [Elasticomyces elasticus]
MHSKQEILEENDKMEEHFKQEMDRMQIITIGTALGITSNHSLQPFKIPDNVVAAMEASYYPTAAQLFLRNVKQEIDEASPSSVPKYTAYQHERKERAVYQLEAKQRFLADTCAALGVSEDQLSYDSLESALQARAQAGRL